jgi:xylan 1,4-beta-xylosidase
LASRNGNEIAILVWHYHDDDVPGPDAQVTCTLSEVPGGTPASVRHYRIDEAHSNAFAVWLSLGSPQEPSPEERIALEQAALLAETEVPGTCTAEEGTLSFNSTLPRQAVSLYLLTW